MTRAETTLACRCAVQSAVRGDPLPGTASTVRRWLLLEHPAAWGPAVPLDCGLPDAVAGSFGALASGLGARPLLVRRPGRLRRTAERALLFADSGAAEPVLCGTELPRLEALATVVPDDVAAWRPLDPVVCVCTHGRHDLCCAIDGRPVAQALADRLGDAVWECTHIGGDRFAGNALLLPWGHYLGRLHADSLAPVLADLSHGRIPLAHYRGRSVHAPAAQVAEHHVRARDDLRAPRDCEVVGVAIERPDRVVVAVRSPAGVERLTVVRRTDPPAALTCAGVPAAFAGWSVAPEPGPGR